MDTCVGKVTLSPVDPHSVANLPDRRKTLVFSDNFGGRSDTRPELICDPGVENNPTVKVCFEGVHTSGLAGSIYGTVEVQGGGYPGFGGTVWSNSGTWWLR